MPINLDVSEADIQRLGIKPGARIALVDGRDDAALAIITGTLHLTAWHASQDISLSKLKFSG